MSQKRYIQFNGDPAGKPLKYTFHRAADFKAAGLATMGSYLLTNLVPMPTITPEEGEPFTYSAEETASLSLLSNAVHAAMLRYLEKIKLARVGFDIEKKCIDTCPDQSTPPNTADDLRRAHGMCQYYLLFGTVIGAMDSFYFFSRLSTYSMTSSPVNGLLAKASFYTGLYNGYQRHKKIISGEWRVTNMPTPEKIAELERQSEPMPNLAIQPTPG